MPAGEAFTAADAFFTPVAFRVKTYEPPLSARSREYAQRLLALPSMQGWYLAALSDAWREEAQEEEAHREGAWLQDFRHAAG